MADIDRFLRELPEQLEDVSRFDAILEDVPGLAKANNLALLNVAARCLEPGEHYVEVGTFRGTSLISAMQGNDDGLFVAMDDWSREGGDNHQLVSNLDRYRLRATIIDGDAFETLGRGIPAICLGLTHGANAHRLDECVEIEPLADGLAVVERVLDALASGLE